MNDFTHYINLLLSIYLKLFFNFFCNADIIYYLLNVLLLNLFQIDIYSLILIIKDIVLIII